MSGSVKYFRYRTGVGDLFAMERDESNLELILINPQPFEVDVTAANVQETPYEIPQNVEPRVARFKSITTVRVKTITIPTEDIYNDLVTAAGVLANRSFVDPATGETFSYVGGTPEKFSPVVIHEDTGLNDGDAD